MAVDRAILIPGLAVCHSCKRVHGSNTRCLCTGTGNGTIQDERGDDKMSSLSFPCPHCGQSHLMILGATVVTDKHGSVVAVCPNAKSNEGGK
jgi:hypothetical protein